MAFCSLVGGNFIWDPGQWSASQPQSNSTIIMLIPTSTVCLWVIHPLSSSHCTQQAYQLQSCRYHQSYSPLLLINTLGCKENIQKFPLGTQLVLFPSSNASRTSSNAFLKALLRAYWKWLQQQPSSMHSTASHSVSRTCGHSLWSAPFLQLLTYSNSWLQMPQS